MIQIAVVEDEELYRAQLRDYIRQYQREHGVEIAVTEYADGDEILEKYDGRFDIIFLDIEMRFLDGITAAEAIREKDGEVILAFITNMVNYAIRGYSVDALDYVLKPITYFSFAKTLDRAISRLGSREKIKKRTITLTMSAGVQKLDVNDIYYIESEAHVLVFYTAKGEFRTYGKMKDMETELAQDGFFRGNKGYLINMRHVDGMEDGCCLIAGKSLLISRAKKKEFMTALSDYISMEG